MQQAYGAGKVSLNPAPNSGTTSLVFKDYAQEGDQMTLTFNTATKKISRLNVNTYMDNPKDTVTPWPSSSQAYPTPQTTFSNPSSTPRPKNSSSRQRAPTTISVIITVALRGAKRPKLMKIATSQETTTANRDIGTDVCSD